MSRIALVRMAILALVVLSLSASCGGGSDPFALDPTTDALTQGVRRSIEGFVQALNERNLLAAYGHLSSSCREQVTFEEFAGLASQLPTLRIELRDVAVGQAENGVVPVSATYAVGGQTVESPNGGRFLMMQEGDEWKFVECRNFGLRAEQAGVPPYVAAETDASPDLPGQFFQSQGRDHLPPGERYEAYNSNPPTSGPHSPETLEWKVYDEPQQREKAVHNMEHGGVVVWHHCVSAACEDVVAQIRAIVEGYLADGALVVMFPYPEMEDDTIALTAWTRLDKFPASEYTEERVRRFIQVHERRYNPEGM
jgi:hypothetical protein